MEIPKINSRIAEIIDFKSGGSRNKFSESIGLAQQTINRLFNLDKRTNKYPVATTDILVAITEMYVDVDARWLLTGAGVMLKKDVPVSTQMADTTVDRLIKEVKELSAENAVLKLENEKLKKDVKHKSNPHPNPSMVTDR